MPSKLNQKPNELMRAKGRFALAITNYQDKFGDIPFDAVSIPDSNLDAVSKEMERAIAGERPQIDENEFGFDCPDGALS